MFSINKTSSFDRKFRSNLNFQIKQSPLRQGYGGHGIFPSEISVAEREGFEPSVHVSTHTHLAGEHLRPLGHLSI
jgi:hypothetical protein